MLARRRARGVVVLYDSGARLGLALVVGMLEMTTIIQRGKVQKCF